MTVTLEAPTRFRWDRLTYASAFGYCVLVAGLSVGVVLGELRDEFGLSGVVAALHGSTFGFGLLVMGMLGVRIVDRIGRRHALATAALLLVGGVTVFCLGGSWPITLGGTVFSGLGGALLVMVMPGVISDHHGEHRAAAFAAVNGAPGLAGVGYSLLVGAALGAGLSWRVPYLGLTALSAVVVAVVAWPVKVPDGARHGTFRVGDLFRRDSFGPWLRIVHATVVDFTPGVWAVVYLREIGGASSGMAPVLAAALGTMLFVARLAVPVALRRLGPSTLSWSFAIAAVGALVVVLAPSLVLRTVGLAIVGFGTGPVYPLTVDHFYAAAGHRLDSVSMGAFCALASGTAVTLGPLALGVLADVVGLRWAMLVVPTLALFGVFLHRPRPSFTDA